MNRISPHVRHASVQPGNAAFSLLAPGAPLDLATQRLLGFPQRFQPCTQGARVRDNGTIRQCGNVFHPEINADHAALRR